jgi:hypothetical protein
MYHYNDRWYTIKELSDMSGIAATTIRTRLRRGYTLEQSLQHTLVDESVVMFNEASWYEDWIGMSTSYLHKIYWKWCVSNRYTPLSQISFTRQIMQMYPNLKTVPTKNKDGYSSRIIRER